MNTINSVYELDEKLGKFGKGSSIKFKMHPKLARSLNDDIGSWKGYWKELYCDFDPSGFRHIVGDSSEYGKESIIGIIPNGSTNIYLHILKDGVCEHTFDVDSTLVDFKK